MMALTMAGASRMVVNNRVCSSRRPWRWRRSRVDDGGGTLRAMSEVVVRSKRTDVVEWADSDRGRRR